MKVNEIINDFKITRIEPLAELAGTLYEFTHTRLKTPLIWLQRADSNKTFAITFKTPPTDDTGVFHILEHSVLNGSTKYPLKEPFVELLKGSLQTFLNAMTFSDRTMYPVASRNFKDFLNLMDVYLDGVFNPLIYQQPEIFWQEGWHLEADENNRLSYNGVVYNEMQGELSSVDTLMTIEMNRLLFPDTVYRFESGGIPESIVDLTFQQFIQTHQDYYHPSNAYVFLDGDMDIEPVLAKINAFLKPYQYQEPQINIPSQAVTGLQQVIKSYASETAEDQDQIGFGYVYASHEEQLKQYAVQLLLEVLCGNNESILSQAIINAGLGESVKPSITSDVKQVMVQLTIQNTDKNKVDAIKKTIETSLTNIITTGIDQTELTAALNSLEFMLREQRASSGMGIGYAMAVNKGWLYGADPINYLLFDDMLKQLREYIGTDFYLKLLSEVFIDNKHQAIVIMEPDIHFEEKAYQATQQRLQQLAASFSTNDWEQLEQQLQQFEAYQSQENTPEQLALMPSLTLSDVDVVPEADPLIVEQVDNTKVLVSETDTQGIIYTSLYFLATDLTEDELSLLALMADLLGDVNTTENSVLSLQNNIKMYLGDFRVNTQVFPVKGQYDQAVPYVVVNVSALDTKKDKLVAMIKEILTTTVFDQKDHIRNILKQKIFAIKQGLIDNGQNYAIHRVNAYHSAGGLVGEYFNGYQGYRWLKDFDSNYERDFDKVSQQLTQLLQMIFTKDRLTIAQIGKRDLKLAQQLIEIFPESTEKVSPTLQLQPLGIRREGIITTANVAFAVLGTNIHKLNIPTTGSLQVANALLSLEYLWNQVRVQGGAYGAGVQLTQGGLFAMYSYRDPNPNRSIMVYQEAIDFLTAVSEDNIDLTDIIIGTIAETDPLLSPKQKGYLAIQRYFQGVDLAYRTKILQEIINTTSQDLRVIADQLKIALQHSGICIVGGKKLITDAQSQLDTILSLNE